MSEIKALWLLWATGLLCIVIDVVAGSLFIVPTGIVWVGVSWKLLEHYFKDGDDDDTDCLGV